MAQAEHVPVIVHAPKSKAANEYRALADELALAMGMDATAEEAM